MLVAGPNMALLKQHQGHAAVASPAKQQKQKTVQSLRGNFARH
jgi:type IV secretory pathway VirB2 component (pilin)